jgi:hypothetical protein
MRRRLIRLVGISVVVPLDWKDFSARHGHALAHDLELLDEADQTRCIRAVLAGRPRKTPFFAPKLSSE